MMSEYAYISHHGVKGQEWGKRRWQDYAGKLTAAGRERYGVGVKTAASLGRFGAALGKAKAEHYVGRANSQITSLKNVVRRHSRSVQLANLRGQRDYYQKKSRGRAYVESLSKKKAQVLRTTFMASDSRFRARMNAGERYVQRMSAWEQMVQHPRPRDASMLKALPNRFSAAKTSASIDWEIPQSVAKYRKR